MLEIFKDNKKIRRELMHKIMCFETFRKIYNDNQHVTTAKITDDVMNSLVKTTKDKLTYLEKNKSSGQVKISQQETATDDLTLEETMSIDDPNDQDKMLIAY